MGTGYTRNDTANNIADGNVINASDLDGEFDAIQAAFNATTGHSHDGTTGEGPQIGTGGIADNAVTLGTKTTGNYVATAGVSGVGLSGSASAEGATFTVTSNATDANTASTIVARDASGNFSAGNVTVGNLITAGNVDGRDVSADGAKLDGIEAGATADQTASEILTLIKTVDGAGSGLDADTLDGVSSASFLRSDAADSKTSGDLSFADNVKAVFGAGSDLEVYHNSTAGENIIDANSGTLVLRSPAAGTIEFRDQGSQVLAQFNDNSDAKLYYNNSPKLATTSSGIDVTGTVTFDGGTTSADLNFGDNDKAVFGAGSDLQIYHDGSASYINDVGTGNLYIRGANVIIEDTAGTDFLNGNATTGEVTLSHSGASRLVTKSFGVNVVGELEADSLDIDGAADITGVVSLHNHLSLDDSDEIRLGTSNDLVIYHDGSNSYISDEGTGDLNIRASDDLRLQVNSGGSWINSVICNDAAGVDIYYNNNLRISTTSAGATLNGTLAADGLSLGDNESAYFGTGNDLRIYHDGIHSYVSDNGSGSLILSTNGTTVSINTDGPENMAVFTKNGSAALYYDNSKKFETTSSGVDITGNIDSVNAITLAGEIVHEGDSDTYFQFVNANEARIVTAGSESIRFRGGYIQAYENVQGSFETASKTGAVTPDMQNYNSFVWTLTGNITLNNPTTELAGSSGVFIFIHSGAGRTVSLGADWETAGGAGLTLSGTAGAVDIVPYFVQSAGNILLGTPQLAFA